MADLVYPPVLLIGYGATQVKLDAALASPLPL